MSNAALRFADVRAVTPTAAEFKGIYRNKQQHAPDFDAVPDRATASGVKHVMLTCMSLRDVDFLHEICKSRPEICSMTMAYILTTPKNLGTKHRTISECSKDVFENCSLWAQLRRSKIQTFKAQLDMIVDENWDCLYSSIAEMPVTEFTDILTPYMSKLPRSGLVHSFVGTKEEMQQLVSLGIHISVNGFSLQDPQSIEMVKALPLESLQMETDAPWGYINPNGELAKQFPMPKEIVTHQSKERDKFEMGKMVKERNESCLIAQVAVIVAGLKGIEIEEVVEAAYRISARMFRLDN